jgi:intraflagellar transport protein 52
MVPGPINGFAPSAVSSPSRSDVSSTILFDTSKSNQFGVNDGLRQIQRLLKNRWRLANTKDRLTIESLSSSRLAILAGPQDRYNEAEFNALRQFIDLGGNLWRAAIQHEHQLPPGGIWHHDKQWYVRKI